MALIGEMRNLTIGGNTYSIPVSEITPATSSALGGIKIGYTTANKNYAVLLDSDSKAYVNVPWTDTTYSSQTAAKNGTAVSLVTTGEKYIWNNMLPLTGGNVSGSVSIDDLTVGDLIVTGNTSFVQGIPFSTITDAPTTVSGYGITDAVTNVAYDSSTYNITKTINGTTTNVLQMPCIAGTATGSCIIGNFSVNVASGNYAFAAGTTVQATGEASVALVCGHATQQCAVAIGAVTGGQFTTASGIGSIAIGAGAIGSGLYTIALGYKPVASASCAIAIGAESDANANYSLAFGGRGTKASSQYQTTMGKWNIEDNQDTYAFILGNGTANDARSNALTIDWSGNQALAGSITLGYGGNDATTLTAAQLKTLISTGTTGQVLTKTASGFEWASLPIYNGGVS